MVGEFRGPLPAGQAAYLSRLRLLCNNLTDLSLARDDHRREHADVFALDAAYESDLNAGIAELQTLIFHCAEYVP